MKVPVGGAYYRKKEKKSKMNWEQEKDFLRWQSLFILFKCV